MNFDGPESEPVRQFFIDNACMWVRDFHVDGLRLDAVHAIFDFSRPAHPGRDRGRPSTRRPPGRTASST